MWTHPPGPYRRKATQEFTVFPPSFCSACLNFLSREGFSRPFPSSTVKSRILCTHDIIIVLHLLGMMREKIPVMIPGFKLTSQRQKVPRLLIQTQPPGRWDLVVWRRTSWLIGPIGQKAKSYMVPKIYKFATSIPWVGLVLTAYVPS